MTRSTPPLPEASRSLGARSQPILRNSLNTREAQQPEARQTLSARSMLGGALLGLGKFDEAEPLLISGYEGMKARESKNPDAGKIRLTEAAGRVVTLYTKPGKVSEWRSKLNLWPDLPASIFARP